MSLNTFSHPWLTVCSCLASWFWWILLHTVYLSLRHLTYGNTFKCPGRLTVQIWPCSLSCTLVGGSHLVFGGRHPLWRIKSFNTVSNFSSPACPRSHLSFKFSRIFFSLSNGKKCFCFLCLFKYTEQMDFKFMVGIVVAQISTSDTFPQEQIPHVVL